MLIKYLQGLSVSVPRNFADSLSAFVPGNNVMCNSDNNTASFLLVAPSLLRQEIFEACPLVIEMDYIGAIYYAVVGGKGT